jgi:threonine synthase
MRTYLVCEACGAKEAWTSPRARCGCGGILAVVLREPTLSGPALRRVFDERARENAVGAGSGVWRFRELVLPERVSIVAHPEGNTPLYRRDAISHFVGVTDLALKHEGENPTGSFKDRGMTVAITQALRGGVRAVMCASTGNTSASMAAYAAQAGLVALVLVPEGKIAMGKLAQALAYGARTLLVDGDFDDCLRLAQAASEAFGVSLLNSVNPWRIEGQKTIVLEMLAQRNWVSPAWIVLPAGNLGNLAAFGKALREAKEFGLIRSVPRLAAVQAKGASPFYRSFQVGFRKRFRTKAETVATAIRIGDPASFARGVRSIRESEGTVTAVSDAEILAAKEVVDGAGIGCEPASAASVAGLRRLVKQGIVRKGESVVAILTGHLLKDPEIILGPRPGGREVPNRPERIFGPGSPRSSVSSDGDGLLGPILAPGRRGMSFRISAAITSAPARTYGHERLLSVEGFPAGLVVGTFRSGASTPARGALIT